jgi:elongation factor P
MATTADFRNGMTLVLEGELYTIVEFMHVKPGKGGAFVRTTLKHVKTGRVVDRTFRAGERVETARLERRPHQFLYEDELGLHFMNLETYEQIVVPPELVQGREFLKEGGTADVLVHAETETPVLVELPVHVELQVVETDPGVRGDTATGGTKPARLESGAVVQVPLFVEVGDVIRINTETRTYIERVRQG